MACAEQAPLEGAVAGHPIENGDDHAPTFTQSGRAGELGTSVAVIQAGQIQGVGYGLGRSLVDAWREAQQPHRDEDSAPLGRVSWPRRALVEAGIA
jgi:hypothetical protein